jgi:DedD protein
MTSQMDSRLKERLIGAAVLVALGVWLIPWVLDGPAQPPASETVALELPVQQDAAPVRAQTIRLEQSTAAPRPERAPTGEAATAHVPSARAEPSTSKAPPRAAADEEPAADTETIADGAWVVQLGSFGDAANAQRLASRVDAYGYDARVSDIRAGGRVMHRVRVGPYATRSEAEAATSSLSAHGFVAQVVPAE